MKQNRIQQTKNPRWAASGWQRATTSDRPQPVKEKNRASAAALFLMTVAQTKSMLWRSRPVRFAAALALASLFTGAAWAKPSIQSVDVAPTPFIRGQPFTINVTASPDVTQGIATVDFHPGQSLSIDLPLTKQGAVWTATGLVPADLHAKQSDKADAKIKVVLVDVAFRKAEQVIHVDVNVPTVFAVFENGILTVTGDDQDNILIASRDTAGTILVNGGAVAIGGGVPTVANTTLIRMLGLKGNDTLTVDDSNGPMPPSNLIGGEGDDTLTGSNNTDELDGGPGNDALIGRGGNDILRGGPGNDVLIGGQGSDQIFGGAGDDQIIWNPGDGSDVVEGQDGQDTLLFNGANVSETIDLSANGQRLRFSRNVANITMDCDGIETVSFRALGGTDQITVNDLSNTKVKQVTIDLSATGGGGDNQADLVVINGTDSDDHLTLSETAAQTTVTGLHTSVSILNADPNLDQLVINAVGGSDTVEIIGSDDAESMSLSANGAQLHYVSSLANLLTDFAGVEQVNLHPRDGADQVAINDLTGTEVKQVIVDLRNGLDNADGQPDAISIAGTDGADHITVTGSDFGVTVSGLAATVAIVGADGDLDKLVINAGNGDDVVDASGLAAGDISLTLDGGAGNDQLIGGDGNDLLIGGRGDDVILGGAGDDTFVWNPGDGSDVIEGQSGFDTLLFNGANVSETIDLSANGLRLRFFRNVANITMDCDGIESVHFTALGGADLITVNDLTGTAVTTVALDLAEVPGSGTGDNQADTVIVNGTSGADVITVTGTPAGVTVQGLAAVVNIFGSEANLDQLRINGFAGDDVVEASNLQAGVINLTVDGGPGDDVLVGSAGPDTLLGGEGDDVLEGGPGFDILDGGPGNNVLIQ